ncbi:MAG: GNAT family N-acetyltransferase [Desulfobulbaceae bacterium]|nr:MAG: GNAT family N-acetyltransferase [Desulfobulbaceae bacterium]
MEYQFKYRIYAEALYDALQEDAFYITLERSVVNSSSKEAMLKYLDYSIKESTEFGEVVTPENHDFGISIWSKPLEPAQELEKKIRKQTFLKVHMGDSSLAIYNAIVDYMSQKTITLVPANAWYLSIVGILPQYQGKGLGPELVTTILKQTDQKGIPTYLETFTPQNMSFYKRLGYKQVECIHEPTTSATYWIMVRPPSSII